MKYRGSFLLTENEVYHLISWYNEFVQWAQTPEEAEEYSCRSDELYNLLEVEKERQEQI